MVAHGEDHDEKIDKGSMIGPRQQNILVGSDCIIERI